ncbi:MAG: Small multidrug export protein [Parcubacteria group bacterium Athens1014_10]|nr:MAG: Small multidrug export protein [Parcubacteria group bacterium Athens1014_10]TSD04992.1 MAG: Small multidrug export protein [Parcubacteria group bacterium Athens0714_12]
MAQFFTMLIAMMPISELRGAIPVALGIYHLSIPEAFFYAVVGNILPVFLILWLLGPISNFLAKKSKRAEFFFHWLFERTRVKNHHNFKRWGDLALILFVAIPLPMTGAWSGALAAFIFDIPYWRAISLIFTGVLIAGLIVTLATTGTFSFLKIIL